jgi:hypothetical protein
MADQQVREHETARRPSRTSVTAAVILTVILPLLVSAAIADRTQSDDTQLTPSEIKAVFDSATKAQMSELISEHLECLRFDRYKADQLRDALRNKPALLQKMNMVIQMETDAISTFTARAGQSTDELKRAMQKSDDVVDARERKDISASFTRYDDFCVYLLTHSTARLNEIKEGHICDRAYHCN